MDLCEQDIQQLIFFDVEGDVTYRLASNPRQTRTSSFSAQNGNFILCGSAAQYEKYTSIIIKAKILTSNPSPQRGVAVQLDRSGNYIGNQFDLGADGAFTHIKLLIAQLYTGLGFTPQWFESSVGAALKKKGFQVKLTQDESEFLRIMPDYNVIWIISFGDVQLQNPTFVKV
jgi:hypothetical protein